MKKENKYRKYRTCPRCGKRYSEYSAISRKDNSTRICSKCGNEEAMLDFMFIQNDNHIPRID